ncbi:MAG: PHP domain-containing protein [Gemmatimonadota bacterium]|nr:PHP domain-containing protein [Gemmatimonadota bacterium]
MTSSGSAAGRPRVDLHLHSTASDGTVSPTEVVRRAARAGLAGLSLTDHDTTLGLDEAGSEAERLGLRFLPGAELSATEPGRSVHLLAFGFDRTDARFQAFLRRYDGDRRRRARAIVERLRDEGVGLEYAEVEAQAGEAAPTRAHVARALVDGDHVENVESVFRLYLSRGRPAFVEKREVAPREVFEAVHAAGGVVILAHPGQSLGPDDVRRWAAEGLDGVEVLHPANRPSTRSAMNAVAAELDLLRSGGSDWHGPSSHRRAGVGDEAVPERWLDEIELRAAASRRRGSGTGERS